MEEKGLESDVLGVGMGGQLFLKASPVSNPLFVSLNVLLSKLHFSGEVTEAWRHL